MLAKIVLRIIRAYQGAISPYLGRHCRFYPSCSAYSCLALRKYGLIKGTALTFWRIIRCNPCSASRIDLP